MSNYDVYLCREVKKEPSCMLFNINPIIVRARETPYCWGSLVAVDDEKPWYKRLWLFITKR